MAVVALLIASSAIAASPIESSAEDEFAPARGSAVVTNFDSAGHQVTRYDVDGNAVDAHDGTITMFNGTYFLYGTGYDCGYLWTANTKFCGFKVYSSPDLTHWSDLGYAVSGASCGGCFRPHVIYNRSTQKYVMWANANLAYRIYTSPSPAGPFTVMGDTRLTMTSGESAGDEGLFVDSDQTAYITYTVGKQSPFELTQRIERLNSAYTGGTGTSTNIPNTGAKNFPPAGTEAPSLFKRGNAYYSLIGPTCPYCPGVSTIYATAAGPLGPWTSYLPVNGDSCGGQPAFVFSITEGTASPVYTAATTYLYGSDLWHASANRAGERNQALANYYWAPLEFDDSASPAKIKPFSCQNSVAVTLPVATQGSESPVSGGVDQTSGVNGFQAWCDITRGIQRRQTFVAGRSGMLDRVGITAFQRNQLSAREVTFPVTGAPGMPLFLDVVDLASGRTISSSQAADASSLGWSPRTITVMPNAAVSEGRAYALVLHTQSTTGCYGMAYTDDGAYPGGAEAYSTDGGSTYTTEPHRALKFWTTIGPSGFTFCTAGDSGTCNFSGTQQVAYGADGNYTYKNLTGPATCNTTTFGTDPAPGAAKACYVRTVGPAGWTLCATGERLPSYPGGECSFSGTQQVAYGADGNYTYKNLTGPATCNTTTFGSDPVFGTAKDCYVRPLSAGPPAGFTLCAQSELGVCMFSGTQQVAYGANGDYTYKTLNHPVVCGLATFDGIDPAYGTVKSCYIGPPTR